MRNEPQHIAPVVQKVLADIAVAWERHHGKPVPDRIRKMIDGEDEETDVAPCRRRSRDPPNEALRVKGEIFGIDMTKGEMTNGSRIEQVFPSAKKIRN